MAPDLFTLQTMIGLAVDSYPPQAAGTVGKGTSPPPPFTLQAIGGSECGNLAERCNGRDNRGKMSLAGSRFRRLTQVAAVLPFPMSSAHNQKYLIGGDYRKALHQPIPVETDLESG